MIPIEEKREQLESLYIRDSELRRQLQAISDQEALVWDDIHDVRHKIEELESVIYELSQSE